MKERLGLVEVGGTIKSLTKDEEFVVRKIETLHEQITGHLKVLSEVAEETMSVMEAFDADLGYLGRMVGLMPDDQLERVVSRGLGDFKSKLEAQGSANFKILQARRQALIVESFCYKSNRVLGKLWIGRWYGEINAML
ncbi:hypothetical protein HDU91_003092 [Kappamyces sp. JEL0680]|nr:hypothetical protein HDU91_003092 [Kappamyces sp. JEL0680]